MSQDLTTGAVGTLEAMKTDTQQLAPWAQELTHKTDAFESSDTLTLAIAHVAHDDSAPLVGVVTVDAASAIPLGADCTTVRHQPVRTLTITFA